MRKPNDVHVHTRYTKILLKSRNKGIPVKIVPLHWSGSKNFVTYFHLLTRKDRTSEPNNFSFNHSRKNVSRFDIRTACVGDCFPLFHACALTHFITPRSQRKFFF